MINKRELEGLIELGVRNLQQSQAQLAREYELLPGASPEQRRAFALSLLQVRRQARIVETLLGTLATMPDVSRHRRIVA